MSTVDASPVAMALATSSTAGMPMPEYERHTGPLRAW